MSINIAKKYIDFSNACLVQYMKLIGGSKISKANFKEILNTYNGVRYYNYYPSVSRNKNANLNYYLNEKMHELYPGLPDKKIKSLMTLVKFVLDLDSIHFDHIEGVALSAEALREDKRNTEFQQTLAKMLKENLIRKVRYLNEFRSNVFSLNYVKTNNPKVTLVNLIYNIKFPVLYSERAIKKVYNSGVVDEQKLLIEYSLMAVKILKEVINNDFGSRYVVSFPYSILNKKNKKNRLFELVNSDAIKEKMIIKMDSMQFEKNQESVSEMIQNGYKLAVEINPNFEVNKINLKRLEVFEYIIADEETASQLGFKDKIIIARM